MASTSNWREIQRVEQHLKIRKWQLIGCIENLIKISRPNTECWEICRKNPKWCSQQLTKQGASKKQKSASNDPLVVPPSSAHTTPVSSNVPIDIDVDPSTPTSENTNLEGYKRQKEKDGC